MDKEKIVKVMDSLEGITYSEWFFIQRKVDAYLRAEISKLNNGIRLADSTTLLSYKD